jgi:hypothetical protein
MRTAIRLNRTLLGRPAIDLGSVDDETVLPADVAIGCKSLEQLNDQNDATEGNRRREMYSQVVRDLCEIRGVHLLHVVPGENTVPYGVPFRLDGTPSAALRKIERRHHVVVMQWPALPSAVKPTAPKHYRNVWLVNFL